MKPKTGCSLLDILTNDFETIDLLNLLLQILTFGVIKVIIYGYIEGL